MVILLGHPDEPRSDYRMQSPEKQRTEPSRWFFSTPPIDHPDYLVLVIEVDGYDRIDDLRSDMKTLFCYYNV
jgi:hypothetical protein